MLSVQREGVGGAGVSNIRKYEQTFRGEAITTPFRFLVNLYIFTGFGEFFFKVNSYYQVFKQNENKIQPKGKCKFHTYISKLNNVPRDGFWYIDI